MKILNSVTVSDAIEGKTKSFLIPHPTKPGKKLRYGSLEGPENGIYIRGQLKGIDRIEFPDYWYNIIDFDSITVSLTSIGKFQSLCVQVCDGFGVTIRNRSLFSFLVPINCFYVVYAERKDVPKLQVEFDA